jgi:hypothetical protein
MDPIEDAAAAADERDDDFFELLAMAGAAAITATAKVATMTGSIFFLAFFIGEPPY